MEALCQGALNRIKIIDLSRLLPGPLCTMILADHGADVTAIEDRRFEKDGHFVHPLYRNKKHMTLNLKSDTGRQIFFKLVKDADVVVEGFRPDVTRKLGISYPDIREVNPNIIYCSISGFGQTGPMKAMAGHDINYLSLAGLLDLIGAKNRPPSIPGIQIADIQGAQNGVIGILLALFHRQQTGRGQYIDVSITDSLISFFPILEFFRKTFKGFPERSASMLSHRYACYNTYETLDRRSIALGAVEPVFWKKICLKLDMPQLIPLQYDEHQRKNIIKQLQQVFKEKELAFWEKEFKDLDACVSPVRTLDEAVEAPMFKEREMIQKDDQGNLVPGIPVKLSRTSGAIKSGPVTFGQDTLTILKELGYTGDQIQKFKSGHVI
ncbi:MAG: CoA transferase [Deltaproteobacteria bacterium]|nr:CoA transferase [Deltaproteobacteria bacterium]